MNPRDPKDCDALDLRAIEMGIDPAQLLHNLSLTVTERLMQLDQMTRLHERLHGAALAADAGTPPAPR